jgi:transposase
MHRRTALINEIRGFLLERGITFAAESIHLRKNLPAVIEDAEQNLTSRLRWLLERMWEEWKQMEIDIKAVNDEIERVSQEDERCRRLRQIPGFGRIVSTATVAAIGNGFPSSTISMALAGSGGGSLTNRPLLSKVSQMITDLSPTRVNSLP